MKRKKVGFDYKNKKILLDVQECSVFERVRGLMFRSQDKAEALLFDFKKPVKEIIHSYFVFFDFVAVWIDGDGKIIDLKIIEPNKFKVRPEKSFQKIIEIPINNKYKEIVKLLVG